MLGIAILLAKKLEHFLLFILIDFPYLMFFLTSMQLPKRSKPILPENLKLGTLPITTCVGRL